MPFPVHAFVALASDFIACGVGWYLFKHLPKELRFLLFFVSISVAANLLLYPIYKIWGSNLWLFHILTLVEYSLLAHVFSFWQRNEKLKKGFRMSIPLFFVVWVASKFGLEDFGSMDNYTSSLAGILLMGFALVTLIGILMETPLIPIHRISMFWVATAVLIYYGGTLFTFALSNVLQTLTKTDANIMWGIHNGLVIAANIGYTGGFLSIRHR